MVIGVFVAVTLIYFFSQFQGKVIDQQHDILQWKGSAQEIIQYGKQHPGESTLWTNSMFGGMPAYQILMSYPANKVIYISYMLSLFMPNPAGSLMLMLICFYILMLTFRINPWLALVGSLAYAFSTYNFINLEAGHETKVWAVGYAPLVLAAVNLAFRGNWLWAFILGVIGVGTQINANHLQITYYLLFIIAGWGIAELISAIREKRIASFMKGFAGLAVGAAIGVGLNLTNLLLTEEYSKYTIRAKSELTKQNVAAVQTGGLDFDYATQWSNGKIEPLTVLIPEILGGGSTEELGKRSNIYKFLQQAGQPVDIAKRMPVYHGTQPFTSGPIYFGAIIVFLTILGLLIIPAEMRWGLFGISLLAFLLSMGKNLPGLSHLFFDHFPFYNKFRAVTMMMVVGQICFPLLGLLALHQVFTGKLAKEKLKKSVIIALSIAGGICAIFVLLPGIFLDFTTESDSRYGMPKEMLNALIEDRESITRMSALRSLVFIGLCFMVLWLYIIEKIKKAEWAIGILALLVLADLVPLDRKYINGSKFVKKSNNENIDVTPTQADIQIMADKDPDYRVLSFDVSPFNDATVSYFHKSVGGYHGAKFRRYQELREAYMDQPIGMFQGNVQNIPAPVLLDTMNKMGQMEIFNLMNTRYFISGGQAFPNPRAYGHAWLVNQICWVKNADQEIDTLNGVNLKTTAVIDERFKDKIGALVPTTDSSSKIELRSYQPNKLEYTYNASGDAFAVFSEIFYDKGWNILIDDKPAEQVRTDYVLRGMKLPSGSHKITFTFEPKTYESGQTIAMICSLLLFASLAFGLYAEVKKVLAEKN